MFEIDVLELISDVLPNIFIRHLFCPFYVLQLYTCGDVAHTRECLQITTSRQTEFSCQLDPAAGLEYTKI